MTLFPEMRLGPGNNPLDLRGYPGYNPDPESGVPSASILFKQYLCLEPRIV